MASENINISFLEVFQGAKARPSRSCVAPFDVVSAYPTMNPIPGSPRPPLTSLPNATHLPAPSPSAHMYGASGSPFVQNYQDQGAIPAPENLTQNSMLHVPPSLSPEMYGAGGAFFVPTYQGQGAVSVPENLSPNSYISGPPSLSPEMCSAGDASFVPTYQGRDAVSVPESLAPNCITSTQPSLSPDMYGAGSASFIPTYQGKSTVPTAESRTPNTTLPPPSPSPEMYNADGASFAINYQVQGAISSPASFTTPMPPVNAYFRLSSYPFAGTLPNASTTTFLPSDRSGRNAQASPVPFQWPLPVQPLATASQQQHQYLVPQEGAAEMGPPREPGSAYRVVYQNNVAFHPAPSAPEICPRRFENQSGFQLSPKDTTSKNRRKGETPTQDKRGGEEYYCEPCDKWFPMGVKKKHDKKHDGEYVCRICEILQRACKPLSRKDALKRHVDKKHPEFKHLLKNLALRILVPRRKNVPEDLQELKQAMFSVL